MKISGSNKKNELGRVVDRPLWILNLSILVRAVHQVGAGVFLASFLVGELSKPPSAYLVLAVASGVVLFLLEGMRHRQIYREPAGVITLVKLLILGAAYHTMLPDGLMVLAAFILSSLGAHAPKIIRHRLLF